MDPLFQAAIVESGTTLLRMPGGSWSNSYDWSACEMVDPSGCHWTWAARPTDFVDLMRATGLPGMWTVSINATAQNAAAAVAFFNGTVDDDRVIGVDRHGVDWGTVGRWAQLRADHGNVQPVPIGLWEVGNEVYGGRRDSGGPECAEFGWEEVWTCGGTDYVEGDEAHDGYLAIREAMVDVDPTIEVGAVGVADPSSWSDWGNEVVESAGVDLDFYSVHHYGFDRSPDDEEALMRPSEQWPGIVGQLRSVLSEEGPIAVTEHNLVAVEAGDTEHSMTKAVNALYLAESIGQMVTNGVSIANQWNLANGTTPSGTDYGLIDADDFSRLPAYFAMAIWGAAGDEMLTVEGNVPDGVRIYPTARADGSKAVILINLNDTTQSFEVGLTGVTHEVPITTTTLRTDELDAEVLTASDPIQPVTDARGVVDVSLPGWSLNLLEVAAVG
jgi:hypothetical protein